MRSRTTRKYRDLFESLPKAIQDKAKAAYGLWSDNPDHRSLRFKKVHSTLPVYSVRIGLDYRAVGKRGAETVSFFEDSIAATFCFEAAPRAGKTVNCCHGHHCGGA